MIPGSLVGTKQGDPLQSRLGNSVLQSAMEKNMETWNERGFGIELSNEKRDCISNLRFADDVLMMANSCETAQKNDCGLQKKVQKHEGLKFTQTKTKILR